MSWSLRSKQKPTDRFYSSYIHNCQNLEATKMSFSGWVDKETEVHPMEYYSALKSNELSSHEKISRKLKCMFLSERSQSEKATYCLITTIWHSGKDLRFRDSKKISGFQRLGRRVGWLGGAQRIFRAVELLCDTVMMDSCNYVAIQSLSHVWLSATPWTAAQQISLSFTITLSLFKLMSIESVMPSNHLIFCHPLLLLPSIFPSVRVFSNELALCIRWLQLQHLSFQWIYRVDFL